MRKIKIAFFAEILIRDFDGATRTIFEIIDRIDKTRFEFLFFCGTPPDKDFGFEVYRVPSFSLPFNKTYKMASMYGMGPKITKKLEEFAPDIIHVSTPSPLGYYALKHGRKNLIPVTTIYHTHFLSYIKYYTKSTPVMTPALEKALLYHNRRFYDRCRRVFVPTSAIRQELRLKGFVTRNMRLWRRGIKPEIFNTKRKDSKYIQTLTRNNKPNILFASRLVWEKNLTRLIAIGQQLQKDNIEHNLIIAGDGVAREDLQSALPHAIFVGHQKHMELGRLYASADCFVFPSTTETFGNVITEAMACGLPCIAGNGGGVKSLIQHGVTGYLCDPQSTQEFVDHIKIVLNDRAGTRTLTKKAQIFVAELSWDKLVEDFFSELEYVSKIKQFFTYSTTHENLKFSYS